MTDINFREEVLKIKDEMIRDIQEICRIDSVLDESTAGENQPFGAGPRKALDCMLGFGKRDGYVTKDVDGYAGHIDIGEGEEVIGVLGHLDVVPVNKEGWIYPPFGAEIHDGAIYGRGTSDDKGPTIAAYYAAKIINQLDLPVSRKIRVIFGCDEESGSRCMKHYFTKEAYPTWAFTPDAGFPVCYGEKSPCFIRISGQIAPTALISMKAGTRANIVPEVAVAIVKGEVSDYEASYNAYLANNHVTGSIKKVEEGVEISLTGKSAHASTPDLGINAIAYLADYLKDVAPNPVLEFAAKYFKNDNHGRNLGIYFNGAMGEITSNLGIINYENGEVTMVVDNRCPHDMDFDDLGAKVKAACEAYGLTEQHGVGKYLFVDPNSDLITKLHAAYVKHTGDVEAKPVTMGGGTYAKTMPNNNCVAFGMEFPNSPNYIHENNELLRIDELILGCTIYCEALYALAK